MRRALLAALLLPAACRHEDATQQRVDALEKRVKALESRLAETPATEAALATASFDELASRLDSADALDRVRAAEAIGPRLMELRVDVMRVVREGTTRQREALAAMLAQRATPELASDLLLAQASNDKPRVRAWLDLALGRAATPDAAKALVADLAHPDESVKLAAIEGLRRARDPQSAAALATLAVAGLGLPSSGARAALVALGEPGVQALSAGWASFGPRERQDIVRALDAVRGDVADQFLRERLSDASPLVGLEAARVLARRDDPSGRALAIERLRSEDPVVARAARDVLDAMETPAAP